MNESETFSPYEFGIPITLAMVSMLAAPLLLPAVASAIDVEPEAVVPVDEPLFDEPVALPEPMSPLETDPEEPEFPGEPELLPLEALGPEPEEEPLDPPLPLDPGGI